MMLTDCGLLPEIEFGDVIQQPDNSFFGAMATFTCHTGYTLEGEATVTCAASGSWSTAPFCIIKGIKC